MAGGSAEWTLVRQTTAGGGGVRCDLPLGARFVAGRAPDAPIRLPEEDAAASRYHAAFEASALGVQVIDLNSRNGVYVGGRRVPSAVLRGYDRVQLGTTVFVLEHRPSPAEATGEHAQVVSPPTWGGSTVKALPYRCALCDEKGPVPALDHEPWWLETEWICAACARARRSPRELSPVQVPDVIGDFDILRFLVRGGMSAVFEARHTRGGMRAAVKVMLPGHGLERTELRRFVKEQRTTLRLRHQRIVRCFGVGTTSDGAPWVASELMSRGDAEALAAPDSDVRTVVTVMSDVFEALAYAHVEGIVHRDIKPSNILLEREGARAKLADFGLAKSFRDIGGTIITAPGEIGGSAAFIAPEQLLGFRDAGPSVDVYGAAATMYFLLTRELPVALSQPFERATEPQMCLAALADERVPIARRRPDLHPWLAQWIDLLVCRDHQRRAHLSPGQVALTLQAFLAER
ncbi:MAG: protein kinase [Deltaproteobacteria bacterium]|nr:protein kinase [Deltaproteobacteria bacterium]